MKYYKLILGTLIVLVVLLTLTVIYLIRNSEIKYVVTEKNNMNNIVSNNTIDQANITEIFNETSVNTLENLNKVEDETGIRIGFNMECQAKAYKNEYESMDSRFSDGFYGRYYIGENICIDSMYADGTSVSTEIKTDTQVIDIKIGTNFDGYWTASQQVKEGDIYNFTSTAYFLFKDGTIGKISTDDIKNGNYTITKLKQYKNIISLVSCNLPEFSGGAEKLYAVDDNNNIYEIDSVSSGT